MKRFKESELRKTTDQYWILQSIKENLLTFSNPIIYQNYLIFHVDEIDPRNNEFKFVHNDYDGAPDANDHRHGFGESIQDCIHQINQYILENEVEP